MGDEGRGELSVKGKEKVDRPYEVPGDVEEAASTIKSRRRMAMGVIGLGVPLELDEMRGSSSQAVEHGELDWEA